MSDKEKEKPDLREYQLKVMEIILSHRGVETRQVHWEECSWALAGYVFNSISKRDEEINKLRKLLHEHNGMCQKKLSDLKERNNRTAEDLDDLINHHLQKFTENGLFRSSAEHWLKSGKPSGSFRTALHAIIEAYANKKCYGMKQSIELLEDLKEKSQSTINQLREEIKQLKEQLAWKDQIIKDLTEKYKDKSPF